MNKNGFYLLCCAIFFCFGLTNCQCSRHVKCAGLNTREACSQDKDCQVMTFPSCRGQKCPTTYCHANLEQGACVADTETVAVSCPRDSRTFVAATGGLPENIAIYKFAYDKLSPFAKSLAGKKISKEDLTQLAPTDSDAICGTYPNESCKLAWDETKLQTVCTTGPIDCSPCEFVNPEFKCGAINKCSGMICL